MGDEPTPSADAPEVVAVAGEHGVRLLIDSEALQQAVYLYRPMFEPGTEHIVDLEIVQVNSAARRLPLAAHIVEGVLASEVFVDMHEAVVAANGAWQGRRVPSYLIERRGFADGQPLVVRYEIATMRVGEFLVQVSVDHTTVGRLASADVRFRMMAEASNDPLLLLSRELTGDLFILVYANPAALAAAPQLRVGARLPELFGGYVRDTVQGLQPGDSIRRIVEFDLVTRRVLFDAAFTDVGDGQFMVSAREITSADRVRSELERSDRVLRAIGEGAFGTIAVYEPMYDDEGDVVELHLLWSAEGHGQRGGQRGPLDPTSVLGDDDLLRMAREMLDSGEPSRSGWVPVRDAGAERSVEYTLVLAGDRFVLEFVERTEELAARTALAMVTATSEAQRSFLSRVSHEMRSPLNVIHGYSQLLGQLHLPEPAGGHVAHIDRGVSRMVQIVDDLLLLGQLDQGLLALDPQRVDVGDLAADILAAAPDALVPAGVHPRGVHVHTDRARFGTVGQLLVEASLAVDRSEPVELAPFARGTSAGVQLVVRADAGVVAQVWGPFVAGHGVPGAGLGLAVARSLAGALDVVAELREVPGDEARVALVLFTQTVG